MSEKKEKEKNFEQQDILASIQKEFGDEVVTVLDKDNYKCEKEAMHSGSILLDSIMWNPLKGGYVRGKIVEISGLQSSGKSTLACHAIRECQKLGETAAYFDLENALDVDYIKAIGVDPKKLLLIYAHSGEECFDIIEKLINMNIGLIIVDSVSNLVPQVQLETSLEKSSRIGSHAALMSNGLRKIKHRLIGKKTTIIFINQLRSNINAGFFANPEITTGGMALPFESDLRLRLRFREKIEKSGKVIGIKVEARIIKNRFYKPFGTTELEIMYAGGIKLSREIFKLALEKEILQKSGSWYSYKEQKFNGPEAAIDFLESPNNQAVFKEIKKKVLESLAAE